MSGRVGALANRLIHCANFVIPKSRLLVISCYPDIEDQVVAILRALTPEKFAAYNVVLLVTDSTEDARRKLQRLVGINAARVRVVPKFSVAGIWAYIRARVVLFTHGLYGSASSPANQVVVNLWHGMPLKRIWSGAVNDQPPQCDYMLSTSDFFSVKLSELSGLPIARIPATGLPRNDLFFSTQPAVRAFDTLVHADAQRVLFFLPTFRRSTAGFQSKDGGEEASPLLMSDHEEALFKQTLQETGTRILVKPHPLSPHYGRVDQSDDNIWIISDAWLHDHGLMLYEALGATDGLISDVSSVIVDHLCAQKPCITYFPDFELYGSTRRFMLEPLEDYLPGPVCRTVDDLCDEIRKIGSGDDAARARRAELTPLLNPQAGPTACDATLDLLAAEIQSLSSKKWRLPGRFRQSGARPQGAPAPAEYDDEASPQCVGSDIQPQRHIPNA
jgi:CDP-glycerol glycerophosphotransferase (TagB/SpsB family)